MPERIFCGMLEELQITAASRNCTYESLRSMVFGLLEVRGAAKVAMYSICFFQEVRLFALKHQASGWLSCAAI